MKQFDLSRFWLTLKADGALQWKDSLKLTASMVFALTLLFAINLLSIPHGMGRYDVYQHNEVCFGFTVFAFIFFMGIGGCFMMNNIKTKQQRIAFFSMPSSNMEKYLARFLWCTVGFLLFFLIALIVADLLRMLLGLALYGNACGSVIGFIIERLGMATLSDPRGQFDANILMAVIMVISIALCSHSIYLLDGVFFRKLNWIFTSVIIYMIAPILGVLSYFIDIEPVTDSDGLTPMAYIVTVVSLLITAFCYWASYRLFCRSQVICNKIINV